MSRLAAALSAVAPLAAATTIHYTGSYLETLEANANEVSDYDYSSVTSSDSHNGAIDLCERQFLMAPGDSELRQCCAADDRTAMIDGCSMVFDANEWDTGTLPEACSATTGEWDCSGVDSTFVAAWMLEYDASDHSYNLADTVQVEIIYDDTTPPEIALPSDGMEDGWWYAIEKCEYYEVPELTAFDEVLLTAVDVAYSITYQVGASDMAYSDSSSVSGWGCQGGIEVDEVDTEAVGTYCVRYEAWDDGGYAYQSTGEGGVNAADEVTLVVEVSDSTAPTVSFEAASGTVECGEASDIPDAGAWCENLPCSDQPDVTALYSLTADLASCEDSPTFDVGYGGCETYALGGVNEDLCAVHLADQQGACPLACASCTEDVFVADSASWDAGWGACATYAADFEDHWGDLGTNFNHCLDDCDGDGVCAWRACPVSCRTEEEFAAFSAAAIDAVAEYVDLEGVGTYFVPYSCSDGYNSATEYQTVVVVDTTPPSLTCPDDVELHIYDNWYEDYEHLSEADDCGDDVTVSDDSAEAVDDSTLGTYFVTFTAVDGGGLTTTCTQTVVVVDEALPLLEVDTCDGEHVHVEACTGTYVECGVTAEDNYDEDIASKVVTSGDAVDEWSVGTYEIYYDACDQSGNCAATATRYVYVEDTTDPVLVILGEDLQVLEASAGGALDAGAGAKCTDTCTALTSTAQGTGDAGHHGFGPGVGPDAADLSQGMTFTVGAVEYYDFLNLYSPELSFVDEQQYYCGEDVDAMESTAAAVEASQAAGGGRMDKLAAELSQLQATCGVYEVVYTCTDWAGNTATAAQWVATVDTTDPIIYYGEMAYSLGGSGSYLLGFVTDGNGYLNPAFTALLFAGGVALAAAAVRRSAARAASPGHAGYDAI